MAEQRAITQEDIDANPIITELAGVLGSVITIDSTEGAVGRAITEGDVTANPIITDLEGAVGNVIGIFIPDQPDTTGQYEQTPA